MKPALPLLRRVACGLLLVVGGLISAGTSSVAMEPPRFQRADGGVVPIALKDSLVAFNDAFNRACEARDVEAMLALYRADVEWLAPDAPPVTGLAAPRASYTNLFAQPAARLSHEFVSATVSSDGSLATMRGFYSFQPAPDAAPLRGNFFLSLVRAGDGWLIVTDIFQAPLPAR